MNFGKLRNNICDFIKEEHVKLGYRKEAIRLYYPLLSLNRLLGTSLDEQEMEAALKSFVKAVVDELGKIGISRRKDRFCLHLPEEASEWVYQNTEQSGFLYDFIETVSKHDITIQDVIDQFEKYSDHVHVEKMSHGEFDYLLYFEDGVPDDFRYCITDEGCHMIYHRFTKDDYQDFVIEE